MKLPQEIQSVLTPELILRTNELYHDLENTLYDGRHGGMHETVSPLWKKFFSEYLPRGQNRTVLDYGCGTGYVSLIAAGFLGPGDTLICADISQAMVDVCRENIEETSPPFQVQTLKISGMGIDLPSASVDVLASNSVLHHLPDLAAFGAEAHRILKPGGPLMAGNEPNGERADYPAVVRADLAMRCFSDPSYFVHRFVERSSLAERLLRGILSRVSPSYRRRNAMLSEIARRLRDEHLIERRLRGTEIQQIVDIHTQYGFREQKLLEGPFAGFEAVEWTTRWFVTSGLGGLGGRLDRKMARKHPRSGSGLSFVLKRSGG